MKIAIVIPTLNEALTIGSLLDAVILETNKIKNHNFSIIVVDGNSKDNTQEIVRQKAGVHLIVENRKGLGLAYLKGINYAIDDLNADAFMEFDGDFQHDPKDIYKLVEKFDEGYDYVIGSRYIAGGSIPHQWPWYRKFISSFGNIVIRTFLRVKVHDATSGFKLTRVNGFKNILPLDESKLISKRHAYKIQFLYSMIKAGARTMEVPITFLNRNKGMSKSTVEDVVESLRVVVILLVQTYRR